jgi:photoactive yellow protein
VPLKTICARCERVIRESDGQAEAISHGLCLRCLPSVHDVAIERLTTLSPDVLDDLPYGVIRLDADGVVLAYNAAQADLSRFRRRQVIGRNFFEDVAPCTNVNELAGWLAGAKRAGSAERKTVRFLFEFSHGRKYVRLNLAFDSEDRTAHVLVDVVSSEDDPTGSP